MKLHCHIHKITFFFLFEKVPRNNTPALITKTAILFWTFQCQSELWLFVKLISLEHKWNQSHDPSSDLFDVLKFMFIAFSYYLFEVSFLGSNHDDIKIILHKQQIYLSLFSKIALPKIQTKTGLFSVTNSNIFGSTTNSENWHHCVFFMLFPFLRWTIIYGIYFKKVPSFVINPLPTAFLQLWYHYFVRPAWNRGGCS